MERTVTYTEEVEREESLVVCDECQREVDDDGQKYIPVTESFGEDNRVSGEPLHFCSECLPAHSDEEPIHVQRAEKWLESSVPKSRGTLRDNIKTIRLLAYTSLGLTLGGLFILTVGLPTFAGFAALCFSALATISSLIGINVVLSADEP